MRRRDSSGTPDISGDRDARKSDPVNAAAPIGDDALSPVKGVVHRYPDRALLKPLLICPVYCRFCFRREHVGPDGGLLTDAELEAAYAWFAAHPEVTEIILTGGDPLMLSARRLRTIVATLSAMPHVQTIRIHSRVPVAEPERLTDNLAATQLKLSPAQVKDLDEASALPPEYPGWMLPVQGADRTDPTKARFGRR